jgi:hypothetical protein
MTSKNILLTQDSNHPCRVALLLSDVINDMDFPQGAALEQMKHCLKADTRSAARIQLRELLGSEPPVKRRAARAPGGASH